MFTITQEFLNAFPNWIAKGWQVGEQIDIVSLISKKENVRYYINLHPPKRPGG